MDCSCKHRLIVSVASYTLRRGQILLEDTWKDRLVDLDRQTENRQTDRQRDRKTDRETERQTERQKDRKTDRETERQTERQRDRQTRQT